MKTLLLGKNGQLGKELCRKLGPMGDLIAFGRSDLDMKDTAKMKIEIGRIKPDLIINAAAYTAVDMAEEERESASMINERAPGYLAILAESIGAGLIHYSTDYVFDGKKKSPYTESDTPDPINFYGKTKLAGEQAVCKAKIPYFIFRTSWLYGLHGRNFPLAILKLARDREELKIVADQEGSPTWARVVADATMKIVSIFVDDRGDLNRGAIKDVSGIYHMCCSGQTTWHGFASRVIELAGAGYATRLEPVSSKEYGSPAPRPQNSTLSNKKLSDTFGVRLPPWDTTLDKFMKQWAV